MRPWALFMGALVGVCMSWNVQAEQCVPYARDVSGIALSGDAWRWWAAAAGQYDRGATPRIGSVMVFKATSKMRRGHVAVVRRIVNNREIRVDHANWPRNGGIYLDQSVIDVSPHNTWTQVRVSFGNRVNPVHGFIYPNDRRTYQPQVLEAAVRPNAATPVAHAEPAVMTAAVLAQHPPSHSAPAATPVPRPVPVVSAPVAIVTPAPAPAPAPTPAPAPAATVVAAPMPTLTVPPSAAATRLNAAVLAQLRGVSTDQVLSTMYAAPQPKQAQQPRGKPVQGKQAVRGKTVKVG